VALGLGNPGAEYAATRHNLGFEVVERVASAVGASFQRKGRSLRASWELPGDGRALLAKPQTFMNLSGRAARELAEELGPGTEWLVICDDFHLPLGRLRFRPEGSDGGQKGLASVMTALAEHVERGVPRLRLGIGEPAGLPAEDFVLRPFKRSEQAAVEELLRRASALVLDWLADGDLASLAARANANAGAG